MIVIHGRVTVRDGQLGRMKQAIAEMERASRAEEGCFDYVFATELNDPHVVRIVERKPAEPQKVTIIRRTSKSEEQLPGDSTGAKR